MTLEQALAATYESNPKLEAQRAALRATDEDVARAIGGFLPQASVSGSYGFEKDSLNTGPNSPLLPVPNGHPRDFTVNLSQPVFDLHALYETKLANASVRAGRAQLSSVEETVLLTAAQAYFDVLADQQALNYRRQYLALLQDQLTGVQTRVGLGDITSVDVQQVTARLAGANAEVAQTQAKLATDQATFERAVGRAPGMLDPSPHMPDTQQSEQMAIAQAEESNPDVVFARQQGQVADAAVAVADSARLPTLSLNGFYRRSKDEVSKGITEDALALIAQLRIPLYQGGTEYADIRKAEELRSQATSLIEEALRETDENVRTAWAGQLAARNTAVLFEREATADQAALDGVDQQARIGERTVIEVLNAAYELLSARLQLIGSQHDLYLYTFRLTAAIGRLNATALSLPVPIYDPETHYRRDSGPAFPRF